MICRIDVRRCSVSESVAETKPCGKCKETKPLSEFNRDKRRKDGRQSWCRACMSAYNKTYSRSHWLQYMYGLTLEEYNDILEAQGGSCAICGKTPEEGGRPLLVDHDHKTGEIRGLLCDGCNTALGYFEDSSGWRELAIKYLQKHKQVRKGE